MEPKFGWKKTLIYSLLPVIVILGGLEVAARIHEIYVPPMQVDYGQGFDPGSRLFIHSDKDPAQMVTNPSKTVSFHDQTFFAKKPARTMRVFALGESSVNYLDYEFRQLEKRLQASLKSKFDLVQIINCGGLSYGSGRLVPICAEIMNYEPDLVLLYVGHNEFEEVQQLQLASLRTVKFQRLIAKSAAIRWARDAISAARIKHLKANYNKRILSNTPDAGKDWLHEFTPQEVAERMQKFRNNLAIMATLCRDNKVPLVMGSIPSNLWKPLFPKDGAEHYREVLDMFAKGEYEKGVARGREILKTSLRHQSSDLENDAIKSVAREFNEPFADVEAAIIAAEPHHVPGETLFNDHCHLNEKGNEILAKKYEEQILPIFK